MVTYNGKIYWSNVMVKCNGQRCNGQICNGFKWIPLSVAQACWAVQNIKVDVFHAKILILMLFVQKYSCPATHKGRTPVKKYYPAVVQKNKYTPYISQK